MYIINITVNAEISAEQHESLFPQHAAWFKKYFDAGKFVMIGPYADRERAGIIIASTESHSELETILSEDSYYPDLANYEIREFIPKMISSDLEKFQLA
ncbi:MULTISPECIES: YciI family protein [Pantoea]|uniref:YCII-related domain-containing protein n=1 Tax=Pantoea cypripedii TaxID=55209 RepID=A0A1X1EJZ8_PANCY|nr:MULTISPECIES: YciI family protein [Pantoea]MBP2198821.1 uncharacterized protein YciI [Pantoea cypripedii]MDE1187216.1 YciI family protein [Pantoea sp.]ORM89270.1 hypothetical protein HA50_21720 [Pantoea cypripedii]